MAARFRTGFERVGIVTGLEAEARIARRLAGLVAVGGGTQAGARRAAVELADRGATALISFGLAGGLDPSLAPGALIVPEAVRVGSWNQSALDSPLPLTPSRSPVPPTPARPLPLTPSRKGRGDCPTRVPPPLAGGGWGRGESRARGETNERGETPSGQGDFALHAADIALSRALGGFTVPRLLAVEAVILTAEEKRLLWRETGCAALDLESGAVAEIARARALPFAVLRAVCDPAGMTLPPLALVALSANGHIAPARIVRSLARDPRQIAALLRLAGAAARARRSLARQVRRT